MSSTATRAAEAPEEKTSANPLAAAGSDMKVTVVPWSAGGSADAYKGALRLWAMVAIAAVLLSISMSDQSQSNASWSDASSYTLHFGPGGGTFSTSVVFSGDLYGGSLLSTTTTLSSGPNPVPITTPTNVLPGIFGYTTFWSLWVGAGCLSNLATGSAQCRAVTALLGINVAVRIFITIALILCLIALALSAEALVLAWWAVDKGPLPQIVFLRWVAPAFAFLALSVLVWPSVTGAAIGYLRDDAVANSPFQPSGQVSLR